MCLYTFLYYLKAPTKSLPRLVFINDGQSHAVMMIHSTVWSQPGTPSVAPACPGPCRSDTERFTDGGSQKDATFWVESETFLCHYRRECRTPPSPEQPIDAADFYDSLRIAYRQCCCLFSQNILTFSDCFFYFSSFSSL